mmetsp:Transcript_9951/g.18685  ORF Transcript_9951/g.18685 Transcript_9951/m.18685 type:complete len:403 (-) Transcript_9951:2-1210(-)
MFLRFVASVPFLFVFINFTGHCHAIILPNPKATKSSGYAGSNNMIFTRREYLQTILLSGTTCTTSPMISNAASIDNDEGLSVITDSTLGRMVRRSAIQGARLFDRVDEQWEQFSDKLRDQNKCDETTGRRLFDNGFRRDGTRVGNPVLGSLCQPDPLLGLDVLKGNQILDSAIQCALHAGACSGDRDVLVRNIQSTKDLVRQSFDRARSQNAQGEDDEKRVVFNFELYSIMRTINNAIRNGKSLTKFQQSWGRDLLNILQTSTDYTNIENYMSIFDKKDDDFDDYSYDKRDLVRALAGLKVALDALKKIGLCGVSEISIPSDDYGNVVTIAIDDYVPLGTEMLLSEQKYLIAGPAQAIVRASIKPTGISYDLDSYYIDPSTTKRSVYNPTQLLISLNNLRKM